MCFPRKEGDDELYQCITHDTPPFRSCFLLDLHKYSKATMRRAIVTARERFPMLKECPYSLNQNSWVPGQGMVV